MNPRLQTVLRWLPAVLWMAMIFYFSHQPGGESGAFSKWVLDQLASIIPPKKRKLFRHATVAVDVQNPLLGPRGCSRIYGPQKGLRPEDFPKADKVSSRKFAE